jgi:hypothetical protein
MDSPDHLNELMLTEELHSATQSIQQQTSILKPQPMAGHRRLLPSLTKPSL